MSNAITLILTPEQRQKEFNQGLILFCREETVVQAQMDRVGNCPIVTLICDEEDDEELPICCSVCQINTNESDKAERWLQKLYDLADGTILDVTIKDGFGDGIGYALVTWEKEEEEEEEEEDAKRSEPENDTVENDTVESEDK